ncbi:MAG: tetratricopeptide repeat protein [Smithella sp.]|nr:tetratricopeptide repeat protein [Smithella sp.]
MKKTTILSTILLLLFFTIDQSFCQIISDEARRHFDRGMASVEVAKTPADYEKAITEFEKAKSFSPDWPEVYYNLGLIQEKAEKYGDAAANLKQYLRLAPKAKNAAAVKSHINKLEYMKEQAEEEEAILSSIVGRWIGIGTNSTPQFFMFSEEGGQLYLTYETTHIIGTSREKFNWHKVPVARQGRHINFTPEFKLYERSSRKHIGDTYYPEYNLVLIDSETLKGKIAGGDGYFFLKDRDGSLWRMDDASLRRLLFKKPPPL